MLRNAAVAASHPVVRVPGKYGRVTESWRSSRYKVIDYGLADFEARYAAGMIGAAADQGTQQAPKEETFRSCPPLL